MSSPESDTLLPLQTSGCQLLPGLCISLYDEHFSELGSGIYRVQPQSDQVLDVLVADFSDWGADSRPNNKVLLGDAMKAEVSPQEAVKSLHARVLASGMPATALLGVLYLRIDMQQGLVSRVGCGAPAPIVFQASGASRSLSHLQPALGATPVSIQQDSFSWRAGDALFLGMACGGALDALALEQAMAQQRQLHSTPAMALHGLRAAWLDTASHPAGVFLLLLQQHAQGVSLDRLELPVSLETLEPLREFVGRHAQRAGLSEDKEAGLVLSTVEVVTNVVRHAKNLLLQAPIEVLIEHLERELVLSVRYFGQAYVPEVVPQTHDLSTYPEGGFGQYIVQQICDKVHYGHDAGVNLVQLTLSTGG